MNFEGWLALGRQWRSDLDLTLAHEPLTESHVALLLSAAHERVMSHADVRGWSEHIDRMRAGAGRPLLISWEGIAEDELSEVLAEEALEDCHEPEEILEQEQRLKLAFQALVYERCWTTRQVLTQLMEPSSALGRALDQQRLDTLATRSTDAAPFDEASVRAELLRMLEPWLTDAKAAWVLLVGIWDGEVDVVARREQAQIVDAEGESGPDLEADEVLALTETQLRQIAEAVRPVRVDSPGAAEVMVVLSNVEPLRYAIAEEHGVSDRRPPESLAGPGGMFDRLRPFIATHPASQYFARWCLQRIEQLSRATDLESFVEEFDRVWFLAVELTNAWEAHAPLGLFNDPLDSQADFDRWAGDEEHEVA